MEEDHKTIYCTSCGAKFDDTLPACPYCQAMNYKGAEAEYLRKLNDVKEDLEDLEDVPAEEMMAEGKRQINRFRKVALILATLFILVFGGIFLAHKADDIRYQTRLRRGREWLNAHIEELDHLNESGEYFAMYDLYVSAYDKDLYLDDWKYDSLMKLLSCIRLSQMYMDDESEGIKIDADILPFLFEQEWRLLAEEPFFWKDLTKEQADFILRERKPYVDDFQKRFHLTGEELQTLQDLAARNNNVLAFSQMQTFLENRNNSKENESKK